MYPDLNFKKNFNFDQGTILLLKDGYYQVMGIPQQPVPQPDIIVLLRIHPTIIVRPPVDSDVVSFKKVELISQLLAVPPSELLEILYA